MNTMYKAYQLIVALPLIILATLITAIVTSIGCLIGGDRFWGYYPGKCWSRFVCRILLLKVDIRGSEHINKQQSYVFVANHQGAMDIFLIYGFLGRNFKWMMKKSLRKLPFVGFACARAGFVFVDKSGPKTIQHTVEQARHTLRKGMSLVVFPEGSRTWDGAMKKFNKGAFQLASDIGLPVVPLTIAGSFGVLPRTKGLAFVQRHTLHLVIHAPIPPAGDLPTTVNEAYTTINACLQMHNAHKSMDH